MDVPRGRTETNTSALLRGERRKCRLWEDKRRWRDKWKDISKDKNNYLCIYLFIFVWQIVNFKKIFFVNFEFYSTCFSPEVLPGNHYPPVFFWFSYSVTVAGACLHEVHKYLQLKKNDCTICKANDSKSHWCYGRCDPILVFDMCSFHSFCSESFNLGLNS